MEQAGGEVRILVARAAGSELPDSIAVLECLGAQAHLEVVEDAAACLARCRAVDVDLVIAEQTLGDGCAELCTALGDSGPPVVVVSREGSESGALAAFRHGAADCVAASPAFAEVLPVVALEQIRRWREGRERIAAARRIRDLEHTNKNIIQNLNSALLVVDSKGEIAFCNPAAESVLGEPEQRLRGRPIADWFVAVARGGIPVLRTLETGERFKGAESVLTRPDGSRVPIGISCAPVTDADGLRIGAVAIFSDLTEIKQLRRQVLQSEKMASIGQLAAGVAHEINNPMGFIHANLFQMAEYLTDLQRVWDAVAALNDAIDAGDFTEVRGTSAALRGVAEEVDLAFVLSDFSKAIRESQEGSERIRHIVQDLRDFSHRDAEERTPTDINECLDSTANIVWPMMKHLVALERDYRALPPVRAYPMQLKQVFMNLLVNAYQAIEERLGSAGDSAEIGTIRLRTAVADGVVEIAVTDTGAGIAPENLDRIFDPFFTTKKVGSGTGLGLSTCFNIVERHGGVLRVQSQPGVETTFTVALPVDVPATDGARGGR